MGINDTLEMTGVCLSVCSGVQDDDSDYKRGGSHKRVYYSDLLEGLGNTGVILVATPNPFIAFTTRPPIPS